MEEISRADWFARVADPSLAEAGCLTAVTGADEDAVLIAFGAELDTRLTLQDWSQSMGPAVALVRLGDGMVVAEYKGFEGSREEVLRKAAAGGRAASIFWNVNGIVVSSCAHRGRILGQAELLGLDDEAGLPADLLSDLIDAEQNGTDSVLAGIAAAARFTVQPAQPVLDRLEDPAA